MVRSSFVNVLSAALDETPKGEIVLRCIIALDCLNLLMVDDYQREAMPLTSLWSIIKALEEGETLPDVELGMRGERFKETKDGEFVLQDPIYIIDGLQRINAAMHVRATKPEVPVRLGATIHFSTSKEWERERFRILNTLRQKVSPNVLLRNMKEHSPAVSMLHSLSTNGSGFSLHDRVAWNQRMTKGELMSALTFAKVSGILHAHQAPTRRSSLTELVPALDKAVEIVGVQNMRSNTSAFFELIDECWGVKRVQYREGAIYLRNTFLLVLAALVSDHHDFWRQPDEKKLFIEAPLRRKIAQFPTHDPQVIQLASSAGKSREMLYYLLRDHINAGKRTKRLSSRTGNTVQLDEETNGESGGEE